MAAVFYDVISLPQCFRSVVFSIDKYLPNMYIILDGYTFLL